MAFVSVTSVGWKWRLPAASSCPILRYYLAANVRRYDADVSSTAIEFPSKSNVRAVVESISACEGKTVLNDAHHRVALSPCSDFLMIYQRKVTRTGVYTQPSMVSDPGVLIVSESIVVLRSQKLECCQPVGCALDWLHRLSFDSCRPPQVDFDCPTADLCWPSPATLP